MKSKTKERILSLAATTQGVKPSELAARLGISTVAVHKHLRNLQQSGALERRGRPPHVIYIIPPTSAQLPTFNLTESERAELNESYCYFTPQGEELGGERALATFLLQTNQAQDPDARVREYLNILHSAKSFEHKNGLINGTDRLRSVFRDCALYRMYYSGFYSLPKYGKTKFGHYLLHAKSGQSLAMIRRLSEATASHVRAIIELHDIDAIAFAPHSIPRKIQFLKEYRKILRISLPEISLIKAYAGSVPVAQKSLSKLSERIQNAQQTIFLAGESGDYRRVLIIDDALGSGATMNEIAKKLAKPGRKIIGYVIVGSYKEFEVIREV